MYKAFLALLFLLPSLGLAAPAQPINSLDPIAPATLQVKGTNAESTLQALYQALPLD